MHHIATVRLRLVQVFITLNAFCECEKIEEEEEKDVRFGDSKIFPA